MSIDSPSYVRITLGEHLSEHGASWFDGLSITNLDNGHALLCGLVIDQAALFGVLIRIRDLGIRLLALEQRDPDMSDMEGDVHTI